MTVPVDYEERVYAGVLGKLIGVYLGRPVEAWSHERIEAELGEIDYYLDAEVDPVLVDDDISGTFVFARALRDHGSGRDLSAQQVGETWLNYLIENRSIIWWGGLGNSTEHTAYLRLRRGVQAPRSGSIELNGRVVAEQIGAQIFIDGWAMVAPGDPELAATLAARAASVSHDGEAVHGAVAIAAMEAQAFVEADIDRLLDTALAQIPRDCLLRRVIDDVRDWHASGEDWRATRARIAQRYGYERYGGNCHVIPNHALIVSALLHGDGDFGRSLMIVNTCGWDTDCNSGNLGCLLAIRGGLAALEDGPDWRGPVADRMYLPCADAGGVITDALTEAMKLADLGRELAGETRTGTAQRPRFDFALPGSVQGFRADEQAARGGVVAVANVATQRARGSRGLAIDFDELPAGASARALTATFGLDSAATDPDVGYELHASPTLHSGQLVRAEITADAGNRGEVTCRLVLRAHDSQGGLREHHGPPVALAPGAHGALEWTAPDTAGQPIADVGVEALPGSTPAGRVVLDRLGWNGAPQVALLDGRPLGAARHAWVSAVDHVDFDAEEPLRLVQDSGTGLLIQGGRGWRDYAVRATIAPHMARAAGLAARVQGLRRHYALLLSSEDVVALVKQLDAQRTVLAQAPLAWLADRPYSLALVLEGARLRAGVDGHELFDVHDAHAPLLDGGVAVLCTEGRIAVETLAVAPTPAASASLTREGA